MANLDQSMDSVPDFSYVLSKNDPVSKAVVDNILGNVSTKKPKVNIRCETCNLDFTSQVTYDTHIVGQKHQKKLKALEILKSLQEEGQVASDGDATSSLQCTVCNITLNSSSQLQMHLTGTKHLNKSKKLLEQNDEPMTSVPQKRAASEDIEEPPAKVGKLSCPTCNVTLNSESQYQQHIDSRKHKDRVSGKKPAGFSKKKNKKGKQNNDNGSGNGNGSGNDNGNGGIPLLSESFLPPNTILGDFDEPDYENNY